jgi:hypothetical protein
MRAEAILVSDCALEFSATQAFYGRVKWSWFLGQICGLAKMYQVSGYATFCISAWVKYAMSGVRLSRAV